MFYCFVQVKCKIKPDVGILIKVRYRQTNLIIKFTVKKKMSL